MPKVVLMPVAVPCPPPIMPLRPTLTAILPTDSDAEARAKILTALARVQGYSLQLEGLLAAYAKPPEPPK
jgi:hypothetical protein